ncbi:alpha/beta hydrolase [Aquabacterium sp. A3]|uniref:alpha/beta fold hydrolase n=1 Tax=Aquabacterium sp. A3 TaxID=3132829 RepID=UPI00311A0657
MNTPWPISEQRLTACGISTRVLQGGANDRATEAVVFVHGNPGSSEDWRALMARVAPHGRVIAMDMPGFGRADKPADCPYSVEAGATFLGEALQRLGVWRAHLVLHDFGGPWGLAWAAMNPMGLASLTLVNTGLMLNYRWHLMARIWRTPVLGELQQMLTTRRGFRWALNVGQRKPLPREFVDRMYDDLDAGTKRAILKLYRATSDVAQRSDMLGRMLKPLNPSTLVVWGEADPYLPARLADDQRQFFTRAEIHRLPDSGHFPFADDPEGVAQAVVPFLIRQLSNRPPGPG